MHRWISLTFFASFSWSHLSLAWAGDVDVNFGVEGRVITDFFERTDVGSHLLIDQDDKIIQAGSASKHAISDHFALVRYNPDGSLDKSFGHEGWVVTRMIGSHKIVHGDITGIGQLSNKKFMACGRGIVNNQPGFALVSYQTDGTLDETFADVGAVIIPDVGQEIHPLALTVDDSDRIIIAAAAFDPSFQMSSFAVFRFLPSGTLDKSFGVDGRVITPIVAGINIPRALKMDHEGNIVVGGFNGDNKFVVVKYLTDGHLDQAFGIAGIATIYFNDGGIDTLHALTIQADDKILVGGDVQVLSIGGMRAVDFGLARLTKEGALDVSFNTTGKQITHFVQPAASTLWALTTEKDGKIIAVGDASMVKGLAIARFHQNGSLDESFGNLGKQIVTFKNTCHWEAVAIQSDQKIVAGGYVYNGKHYDMALTRLLTDAKPMDFVDDQPLSMPAESFFLY